MSEIMKPIWVHVRILMYEKDVINKTQTEVLDIINERITDPESDVLWNIARIEPYTLNEHA